LKWVKYDQVSDFNNLREHEQCSLNTQFSSKLIQSLIIEMKKKNKIDVHIKEEGFNQI